MTKETIFLPTGAGLTVTPDEFAAGHIYKQVEPGAAHTYLSAVAASTVQVLGPYTVDYYLTFDLSRGSVTTARTSHYGEGVQDSVGAMVTGNTESNITVTYQDSDGTLDFTVADTTVAGDTGTTAISPGDTLTIAGGTNITTAMVDDTLTINNDYSDESIQDLVGAMTTGNTETGISVDYQDDDGTIDFVVSDITVACDTGSTGITPGDTLTISGGTNITTDITGDTVTITNDYTDEVIQDLVGAMLTGNTETGISVDYQDDDGTIDFVVADLTVAGDTGTTGMTPGDTLTIAGGDKITTAMSGDTLTITNDYSDEVIQDLVGAMLTGNTETGISVDYQDDDGTIDFVVADLTVAGDTGTTGMTPGDTLTIAGGDKITTAMSGDTLTITNDYSDEVIQDLVGAMTTGNTETGITVTYQDDDGTIDFVVADLTVAGDTGTTGMTPGDTLTIAGGDKITTAMSGDTLTIANDYSDAVIQGLVGGMVTGNTETGITVTYQSGDQTIDFEVTAASDSVAGIVELATVAEVNTGTATDLAVTPAGVAGWAGSANVATVGTITSGTWSGSTVAVNKGGTGATTYTDGQLLIGNTTGNTLAVSTLTGGTNLSVVNGSGSITLNVDDAFLSNGGDIGTGVYDFGGATSFEIPNGTSMTTNAAGQIAMDTDGDGATVTTGVMQGYDGTNTLYWFGATNYPASDNDVMVYDSATHTVKWEAQSGVDGLTTGKTIALGMIL